MCEPGFGSPRRNAGGRGGGVAVRVFGFHLAPGASTNGRRGRGRGFGRGFGLGFGFVEPPHVPSALYRLPMPAYPNSPRAVSLTSLAFRT